MSNLNIGNINSGRDTNVQSNVDNSTRFYHSIENIKNGIESKDIKDILDNLVISMKKKDEPSIESCIKKLGSSAITLYKLTFAAIKAIL